MSTVDGLWFMEWRQYLYRQNYFIPPASVEIRLTGVELTLARLMPHQPGGAGTSTVEALDADVVADGAGDW